MKEKITKIDFKPITDESYDGDKLNISFDDEIPHIPKEDLKSLYDQAGVLFHNPTKLSYGIEVVYNDGINEFDAMPCFSVNSESDIIRNLSKEDKLNVATAMVKSTLIWLNINPDNIDVEIKEK